ncbi:DMT family transporter [Alicyclobacillus sp. ALC3]|uniref:DMT family transporter n=1 Tax=Alicyclobacillus sp. ALC3 TaxID=2796143 RepID=UPI002379F728|nr:multidrug resistance efflux transporter family protein [Alicyclobacillus sp. ALC3]
MTTSTHEGRGQGDETRKLGSSILLGLLSSLFFAVTFVLNQRMAQAGGSWQWSASLRYLFMFPMLLVVVSVRGTLPIVVRELARAPIRWLIWSTVGFGLFYIPLCVSAKYAPSWLVAATWQFTIVAGSLLSPLFRQSNGHPAPGQRHRIPVRGLLMSLVILGGIVLVELGHTSTVSARVLWLTLVLMGVGTFAYPLGNRKMMEVCGNRLAALERVFGMTLASLPLWLVLSVYGLLRTGPPTQAQVVQCVVVALSSGVIATALFFAATDRTRGDVRHLAVVEATQSGEVVFTVLLGLLFTNTHMPSWLSVCGIILIVLGMVGHSLFSRRNLSKGGKYGQGHGVTGSNSVQ